MELKQCYLQVRDLQRGSEWSEPGSGSEIQENPSCDRREKPDPDSKTLGSDLI